MLNKNTTIIWNGIYTEIAGDLVTERKQARFLTLTALPGIHLLIVSLLQKCKRLCHLRIKRKVAEKAPVNVAVNDIIFERNLFMENYAYKN